MKKHILIHLFVLAVVLTVCVPNFAAAPRIGSTVGGSLTVPASRYQPSMRPIPNEAFKYQRRNELLTGNVPGGKHFRGSIPYSPRYEFSGPLATDRINSFIRRASSSPYQQRGPSNFGSYYLPSRTVPTFRRLGEPGLTVPRVTFPGGTGQYKMVAPIPRQYDPNPYRRRRPLEQNISMIELKMLRQAQKEDPHLVNLKQQVRDDVIREVLLIDQLRAEDAKAEDKKALDGKEVSYRDERIKSFEPGKIAEPAKPLEIGLDNESTYTLERERIREQYRKAVEEQMKDTLEEPDKPDEPEKEKEPSEDEQAESLFPKIDHQTAMNIIKPYKTFKEYARAKFSTYMRIGNTNMKDGKYYKAADAFTLAAIYAPDSPVPYGSRGIALFAAGEHFTSIRYLEKAFDLSDAYAAKKMDLGDFIGKEILDKRLSELIRLSEISKLSRFTLLASYIQYQIGDLDAARSSLDSVSLRMQGDTSIEAMRKTIESAKAPGN